MNIDISVKEEVYTAESIGEAVAFIEKIVEKILSGELDAPVSITISLPKSNSPPALGISVADNFNVGDMLR